MRLRQQRDSLRIKGGRPEQSVVVLSLRDNVLGLRNLSAQPGEPGFGACRRFGQRLASRSAAVRDEQGRYLGQGFHFSLTPGMKGLGLTTLPRRCAERMWELGATLVGDGIAGGATRVALQVRKRNTFFSTLCGEGGKVQSASLQPHRNLLDPREVPGSETPNLFTEAAIMAPLNVPRAMFESTAFVEGLNAELAGYGLYGDYVVFIPAAAVDAGVQPEKVEDILLRLTILSVASP